MATKRSTTEQAQAAIKAAQETAAEWVELERLHGWEHNPKRHPDAQVADLMRSIKRFGWGAVILARPNGEIIAGHGRLEAAKRLGLAKVPVRWLNLDPTEAHLLALADNKLTEIGEWDDALVGRILSEAQAEGADLTGLGWDESELLALMAGGGESEKGSAGGEDSIPEQAPRAVSRLGETWVLGPHRLTCGDSADPRVVQRATQGRTAPLIWTDPPYNIGGNRGMMASDIRKSAKALKDASWDQTFRFEDAIPSLEASMAQDCTVYVCSSQFLAGAVWAWMDQRMDFYSFCEWFKTNPMPSLAKRHWTWTSELICYGTRGKHTFNFPEQGHALSVWSIPGRAHESAHPTEKPTAVPAHAISHSSREGDLVIDLFTGAGSTVLACESLGRVFAGVELDPRWIDTTILRWQSASGKPAVLEGDGRSFDEVSRERLGEGD